MKDIHLAIVDDDKLVVQLLAGFLQGNQQINICLTAFSGNRFLTKLKEATLLPEIVLMDLKMEDGDGISTIEILVKEYPQLKVIVLSSYHKPSYIGHMFKLGVHAFLPKETDKEELLKRIHEVANKGYYFSTEQLGTLRNQVNNKTPAPSLHPEESLSDREVAVLQLICQQHTAKEIADKLFLSPKTVETHKGNLLLKTGTKNTAGLIIHAIQKQIINVDEILSFN